ncbi:MAG TPA: hypothetical protein QGF58_01755 [Myxococcota bacterium]|nr:hypothetical protein [Myxococcota bacterium]
MILVGAALAGGLQGAQEALILGHESMTEEVVAADPEALETLAWGEDLYRRGLYEEAWLAFDQAAFELGEASEASRARFRAGEALWAAGELARAEQVFQSGSGYPFVLAEAETMYWRGDLQGAGLKLQLLPATDEVLYRQAWIWLREGEIEGAAGLLSQVSPGSLADPAAGLSAEIQAWQAPDRRHPGLAGGLSAVVPGAGQVYAGSPREGVSALLLTGVLAGSAGALARREVWGGAALFGGFALASYGVNIHGAVQAARAHNERLEAERLERLRARYELHMHLADEGMDLVLEVGPPGAEIRLPVAP